VVFLLAALLLGLPSLKLGLQFDDIYHRVVMLDLAEEDYRVDDASLFGLYSFLDGDSERNRYLMNQGVLPWWALPEIKYTFFRPLTELSIWIDYQLWPDTIELMHLHSLLWFCLSVLACFFFFRSLTDNLYSSLLASACFLLSATHGITLAWLASRNALIAIFFGLLAATFFIVYSQKKQIALYLLSFFSLLLSMAAGEIGITSCAFIALYGLLLVDSPAKQRVLTISPFVVLTLSWIGLRSYLGFGTYGSGQYADPFVDFDLFFASFSENISFVPAALWSGIPVEIFISPGFVEIEYFLALVFLFNLSLLLIYFPFWVHKPLCWFYLLLLVLSIVPISSSEIQSRVLVFACVPAYAFMIECVVNFYNSRKLYFNKSFWHLLWKQVLVVLSVLALVSHLVLAPVLMIYSQFLLKQNLDPLLNTPVERLSLPQDVENKKLVLINPPNATVMGYLPLMRQVAGKENAESSWLLSSGHAGVSVFRSDYNTLEIEPNFGFLSEPSEKIFRSSKFPLEKGQMIKLDGMEVIVLKLNEKGLPQKAEFKFEHALEDNRYLFKSWAVVDGEGQFVDFNLPEVGESLKLPKAFGS
jgi:hypothetical protein